MFQMRLQIDHVRHVLGFVDPVAPSKSPIETFRLEFESFSPSEQKLDDASRMSSIIYEQRRIDGRRRAGKT